ncbi:MAG: DNA translocase FtsK [Pirellulales bacterium]
MFEERNLKLDLFTLLLLAGCLFLGVSLGSYHATDPPSTLISPPSLEVENACGWVGAYASGYLLHSLGFGAYYLVGSLLIVIFLMVTQRQTDQPILRSMGWAMSLMALSTIASMGLPTVSPGPEIGAGGYLGAMGHTLLETHFANTGAYILIVSVLLAGLLLSTDYLLLRFATLALVSSRSLLPLGHLAKTKRAGRVETDLENEFSEEEEDEEEWEYEEEEEEDAPTTLRVRTPNRHKDKSEEDDASMESQEQENHTAEDDSNPAEEITTEPTPLKKKLASALSFKKPKKDKDADRNEILDQLEAASEQPDSDIDYQLPSLDLLLPGDELSYEQHEREVRRKAKILEKSFQNFGLNVKVVEIETGPVIAQYEVELEAGLRLSKITNLADDLAIALRVPNVRIVAPIPGKNSVGIEVPNENRQLVRMRDVIEETDGRAKRMKIPIFLGKDVSGSPMVVDLAAMPHLLIAGRTGTGKSVCLNSIILSILMSRGPDEVRMLMIDPKMVELSGYQKLPHLMHPVVTDMRKAEAILSWSVDKMEERYQLLAKAGVRHLSVYNQLSEEELRERIKPESEDKWQQIPKQMPFIVIVADEIADLMMTAGKDVEQHVIRLAQKSRAVGIHLILATQKPTVDVITGLIKSNLPARIAFQVASRTDSRVVLDEMGADKLLGNGDMLFLSPGTSTLLRGQGTFLSDDEITRVVDFAGTESPQFAQELVELKTAEEEEATAPGKLKNRDELYESAVDIVVREQRGSVSLLQRHMGIGYGRAARLVDYMAEDSIVGEYNGSQAREVLLSPAEWEAMNSDGDQEVDSDGPVTVANVTAKPHRINTVLPGEDEPSDLEDECQKKPSLSQSSSNKPPQAAPWEELELDEDEEWEDEEEENEEAELAEDEEEELGEDEEEEEEDEEGELAEDEEEELGEDEEEEEEDEEGEPAEDEEEELGEDEEWVYEEEEEEEDEVQEEPYADSA